MLVQATLGGGCYWCLESYFMLLRGVENVVSGYSGGHTENPTTQQVYAGDTGHIEVVQISFNPQIISYQTLLEVFFTMHDPTTPDRQGNDVGEIYRSVIFYHNEDQQRVAQEIIENFAEKLWSDPIVTQVLPYAVFWPADESMQNYYEKNPNTGYCQIVINPKIQKLKEKFKSLLK